MTDSEIDGLVAEAAKGIPDEESRKRIAERLNAVLRTTESPGRPNFPEEWRSEPNVMFDRDDPKPEPFDWGPSRWITERAYDEQLAQFLGFLACDPNITEGHTLGLARRARAASGILGSLAEERRRLWPSLFAARLIGRDCPPAKGLLEDMRHDLEQLAAKINWKRAAATMQATSPLDAVR
jgi:hypothetical protein